MLQYFLKVTPLISLLICHFRFSIFVLETLKLLSGNVVGTLNRSNGTGRIQLKVLTTLHSHFQSSQHLQLNPTCAIDESHIMQEHAFNWSLYKECQRKISESIYSIPDKYPL